MHDDTFSGPGRKLLDSLYEDRGSLRFSEDALARWAEAVKGSSPAVLEARTEELLIVLVQFAELDPKSTEPAAMQLSELLVAVLPVCHRASDVSSPTPTSRSPSSLRAPKVGDSKPKEGTVRLSTLLRAHPKKGATQRS